jgi:FkbM family methyltransferase
MRELILRLADGTLILVPASLSTMTTYVLLEQEAWFEKEAAVVPHLLKLGMTAIDIGANVGIYSLSLARRVGSEGAVYAYEPAGETRRLLAQSREINRTANLHIIAAALSDTPRAGHLALSHTSELHSLSGDGAGEPISITSLDEEDRIRDWRSPDFVKIDAEGEEQRILEGGRAFFARHSPLVMFEIKTENEINRPVIDEFRAMSFRTFRLLPGAPMLVPVGADDLLDPYELNLFAAKPDRVGILAGEGWLADYIGDWSPDAAARAGALTLLAAQAFGPSMSVLRSPPMGSLYRDALAGYATWRAREMPPPLRYAGLRFSFDALRDLCQIEPQPARLSTFARVAWELGERQLAIVVLKQALEMGRQSVNLTEQFWPPNPRFDAIAPGRDVGAWFVVAALEQLERTSAYSSFFVQGGLNLDRLSRQPFVSTEIERRHMLKRLRRGERVTVPKRLCKPAQDHINFELWRSGAVPNSVAPDMQDLAL